MHTSEYRVLGVCLLALTTIGLCGCPLGGGNQETPPPATEPGFIVRTWATTIIGGEPLEPSRYPFIPVSGTYDKDIGVAMGSMAPYNERTDWDGEWGLLDRRLNAYWNATVHWTEYVNGQPVYHCGELGDYTQHAAVTTVNYYIDHTCEYVETLGFSPPWWIYDPGSGGELVVQGPGVSSTYGMPVMDVFYNGNPVAHNIIATSASGNSATFPLPTNNYNGNSAPLSAGFYAANVLNENSDGSTSFVGTGFMAIGNSIAQTTPYGVTAFDDTTWSSNCMSDSWYGTYCSGGQGSKPDYAVTLASSGQVCFEGACVNVGSEPTDLKTWGTGSGQTYHEDDGCNDVGSGEIQCYWVDSGWNGPRYAITTDYASNTSTIVDLLYMNIVATIPVGTNPMAVVLDSSQQNAYIANYGSGTVSQINLSGHYVANTIYVGANPAALSLAPNGQSVWVGGLNYMDSVNLSNFAVTTDWLEGQATSVAISAAQNSWVCTTISSDQSTFVAEDASLSDSWNYNDDVTMPTSGTYYAGSGTSTTPPPYLKASSGVTSTAGNGIAVTSTPTGFAVIDLVAHTIILQGTTPTPVRGIATDAAQGIAYLTLPESNSIVTVPLPVPN